MFSSSELRFLADEMNISIGEVGFLFWKNETREIQRTIINIINQENEFNENNDSRFNPDRRGKAEDILAEFLAQLKL